MLFIVNSSSSGVGSGGARGANGPSNNSQGGPGPPIFPHAYATLDAVVQTLCDVFNKQASFKTILSEVHKLVLLYLTVPVTTATAERSFSGLKRIKTYLRNSMTQQRLNHCILLHIHRNKTDNLDLSKMTAEFIKQNENILETYHLSRHIYAITTFNIFSLTNNVCSSYIYIYIYLANTTVTLQLVILAKSVNVFMTVCSIHWPPQYFSSSYSTE